MLKNNENLITNYKNDSNKQMKKKITDHVSYSQDYEDLNLISEAKIAELEPLVGNL
jgi:hypothetical protein